MKTVAGQEYVCVGRKSKENANNWTDSLAHQRFTLDDVSNTPRCMIDSGMHKMISMCVVLASSCVAHGQAMPRTQYTLGIGSSSCGYWMSLPERQIEGKIWLWGYWSGLNSRNLDNSLIGKDVDGEGIAAEVKKVCEAIPAMPLIEAVALVHTQFKKHADATKPQRRKAQRRRRLR